MLAVALGLLIVGGARQRHRPGRSTGRCSTSSCSTGSRSSWYVFNVADAAIVAGVALLLYDSFVLEGARARRKRRRNGVPASGIVMRRSSASNRPRWRVRREARRIRECEVRGFRWVSITCAQPRSALGAVLAWPAVLASPARSARRHEEHARHPRHQSRRASPRSTIASGRRWWCRRRWSCAPPAGLRRDRGRNAQLAARIPTWQRRKAVADDTQAAGACRQTSVGHAQRRPRSRSTRCRPAATARTRSNLPAEPDTPCDESGIGAPTSCDADCWRPRAAPRSSDVEAGIEPSAATSAIRRTGCCRPSASGRVQGAPRSARRSPTGRSDSPLAFYQRQEAGPSSDLAPHARAHRDRGGLRAHAASTGTPALPVA